MKSDRELFEDNMRASPYEWDAYKLRRYPNDPTQFAWPDSYADQEANTAWHVWEDAIEQAGGKNEK